MKFTEKELEKIRKERMEEIDSWLENEYGVSYTRLEKLHDFVVEQDLKHQEQKDKEIERLNKIINELEKELKEYLNRIEETKIYVDAFHSQAIYNDIEYILDKLKKLKENK